MIAASREDVRTTLKKAKVAMARASVTTGVPQLDLLLGGGIVSNSLLLVAGPPGSGKTVLAAQIAFAAAQRGEQVLFVTAFSEPHSKLLSNLQSFAFFDPARIGDTIKLLNVQQQITASLDQVADLIVREARDQAAQLVLLDGFQGMLITSGNSAAPHQFLYDLNSKLHLLGITAIITYDLPSIGEVTRPELTAVDGIVALSQELIGDQALRIIQVVKQRGAAPLLGRHTFRMTDAGIICYPRQEAVVEVRDVAMSDERVGFGVPTLDVMLSGGFNRGTTTIIAGAEGVGKTLLGLHYVGHGAAQNEPALLLTFHETPQQLIAKARIFGLDLTTAIDAGKLQIVHHPPAELNADMVAQQLRDLIVAHQPRRLVIDGLNEIERPLIERGRAHGFFASLITLLRSYSITTCITQEIDPVIGRELSYAAKNLSALADNVLLLEHSAATDRRLFTLTVLKMRYSAHDRQPHEYQIVASGFDIAPQPLSES
jgi:circadian clock protein KaiC